MNACPKTTPTSQLCPAPHTLGNGARGKTHINGDSQKGKSGAKSLKSLAYKVLQRGKDWGKNGANAKKQVGQDPRKKGALPYLAPHYSEGQSVVPIVSIIDEPQPVFKQTVLMVRHNGKPQSCVCCGYWEQQKGHPWWMGTCALTGKGKSNKSHCDVLSYEDVLQ